MLLGRMYISWYLGGILCWYLLGPLDVRCHFILGPFSCSSFCLSRWSIYWWMGVLISPIVTGFVLIHVFHSTSMLFMKLGAPEFGAYMFNIVIFSSLIDPLTARNCPSLSLLICFHLKSIMPAVRLAMPACFLIVFSQNTFPSFHFRVAPILKANWVPCR